MAPGLGGVIRSASTPQPALFEGISGLDSKDFEDVRHRAEAGDPRLKEHDAHPGGEQQPPRRNKMPQRHADENHGPGKSKDRSVEIHCWLLSFSSAASIVFHASVAH